MTDDTPRTDANALDVQAIAIESDPRNRKHGIKRDYVPIDFARTLERENAALRSELETMRYLAAEPHAIGKVHDAFGPLSLWTTEGLKRHTDEAIRAALGGKT